jgi:hypothetical protein
MLKEFDASHTIHRLAFGETFEGMVNPLDGTVYKQKRLTQVKYTLQVVPTTIVPANGPSFNTNQYSAYQTSNLVDFTQHSFQLPGIFFEYDFDPIRVKIIEKRSDFLHLFVRLCAIVGGLYVLLGIFYHGINRALTLLGLISSVSPNGPSKGLVR